MKKSFFMTGLRAGFLFIGFTLFTALLSSCKTTDVTSPFSENEGQIQKTEILETKNGKVRGISNPKTSVELFAGIPFAEPPVGNLRWKEPVDVQNWDGILEADHFAPMAMQNNYPKVIRKLFNAYIHSSGDRSDFGPMSEDCLYLNIWRPTGTHANSKLPVLVYIHGGSLTSGSSWFESYDGERLAQKGIIVITIAYRLGVFGYFAHEDLIKESPNKTTGNYGLLDQIKALEWINQNVETFGGDLQNITIAGESAGSSSVNALCASPLSKGLFRRAIAESSSLVVQVPSHTFRSKKVALSMGKRIMEEFKATSIEDLRAIPAEKLVKTSHANNAMTVDSYAMPEYPWEIYQKGLNHEEALLNGFNHNEGLAFTFLTNINKRNYKKMLYESPYISDVEGLCKLEEIKTNKEAKQFYTDIFSVVCFTYPHYSWTKVLAAQGKPVYEYVFTKENIGLSTMHSGEMAYAYGNLDKNKKNIYNGEDYKLEAIMTEYWANFVKYGNPNGEGLPEWTDSSQLGQHCGEYLLELGTDVRSVIDPFFKYYKYINFDIDPEKRPPTFGKKE